MHGETVKLAITYFGEKRARLTRTVISPVLQLIQ